MFGNNKLLQKFSYGVTFDEILMIPQYSDIKSRSECSLETKLSKNINLKMPFVSSPMDTVTEDKMAIGMARFGGIGIIHRYQTIEKQCEMVNKVKRAENFIIEDPYLIDLNDNLETVYDKMENLGVSTFLVTDLNEVKNKNVSTKKYSLWEYDDYYLKGILTNRDIKRNKFGNTFVKDIMTPIEKMIYFNKDKHEGVDLKAIKNILVEEKIEKLPIIDKENKILGLSCFKDIMRLENNNYSNKDKNGNLICGTAIGCKDDYLERTEKLIESGCDCFVIDVANGHNELTINSLNILKETYPKVDFIAGNVASGEGARKLIEAGADGIRCGIGNGSICITRIVSGSGVPQFSALMDTIPVCQEYNVPLISDGGNKNSGNMCKALALGANSVMMGRLIAGTIESPGLPFLNEGKLVKIHRGMAGFGANLSKAQKTNKKEPNSLNFSPEGVEGYVNYSGDLKNVLNKFALGIKSGMSYMGAHDLNELREKVKFMIISNSSINESNYHSINKI